MRKADGTKYHTCHRGLRHLSGDKQEVLGGEPNTSHLTQVGGKVRVPARVLSSKAKGVGTRRPIRPSRPHPQGPRSAEKGPEGGEAKQRSASPSPAQAGL